MTIVTSLQLICERNPNHHLRVQYRLRYYITGMHIQKAQYNQKNQTKTTRNTHLVHWYSCQSITGIENSAPKADGAAVPRSIEINICYPDELAILVTAMYTNTTVTMIALCLASHFKFEVSTRHHLLKSSIQSGNLRNLLRLASFNFARCRDYLGLFRWTTDWWYSSNEIEYCTVAITESMGLILFILLYRIKEKWEAICAWILAMKDYQHFDSAKGLLEAMNIFEIWHAKKICKIGKQPQKAGWLPDSLEAFGWFPNSGLRHKTLN